MRIGVLEDDAAQIELYLLWLRTAQHQAVVYRTVSEFTAALSTQKFDLLLIDRALPDGSGEMALRWVREHLGWALPVIFVTAHDAEPDIAGALRLGADDYVIKPPKYFELIARIEALARRARGQRPPLRQLGHYTIHQENREILLGGKAVDLTQKEFELACYLFDHPGRLLSRVHLLEAIWGLHAEIDTRTVDTHISRLRRKLCIQPDKGWEIIAVYGYGYRMEAVAVPH